jgi:predicted dehydrogenase
VDADDLAASTFVHSSGVRGQWFFSQATPPRPESGCVEVVGPLGALQATLSRGNNERLRISRPDEPEWKSLDLPAEALDGQPHALGAMMRSFVDACLRGSSDPEVDAGFADGLAAQAGLEAVMLANEEPRWVRLAD